MVKEHMRAIYLMCSHCVDRLSLPDASYRKVKPEIKLRNDGPDAFVCQHCDAIFHPGCVHHHEKCAVELSKRKVIRREKRD